MSTNPISRRNLLKSAGAGFGHLAMLGMLPGSAKAGLHLPARAKRVIFLFMHGGVSHVDTFDYKPKLIADHGKPLPFPKPRVQFASTGNLGRPLWDFKQHGESGAWISSLFPEVAKHADDLCIIKSVHGTNEAHGGALLKLHTGTDSLVRPSMGSWIDYGLGSENENLPGFVTINPSSGHGGSGNWSSAFLPSRHQGVRIESAEKGIPFLAPPKTRQRKQLDLLQAFNQDHQTPRATEAMLDARIRSFELAYAMQSQAPDAMDISSESDATKEMYGVGEKATDEFGKQCLFARRLAERGVRFIEVRHSYWDQHNKLKKEHERLAHACDKPIAGLLADLKSRGLLDDTLVLWGSEFGRTPTMQGGDGRDHNPHAFTMWMAGGGTRGGMSYGETDEYGFYVQKDGMHVHDLHATILHLLGIDHEELTFRHGGRDFRLTDVEGKVAKAILA